MNRLLLGDKLHLLHRAARALLLLCAWFGATSMHAGLPGTVVVWGNGQSTIPAGLSGVTGIAGGESHTVAVKSDGAVVTWGGNESGQTTIPAGLSNVLAVAAGDVHTVALKGDGTVVAWGGIGYDARTEIEDDEKKGDAAKRHNTTESQLWRIGIERNNKRGGSNE